MNLTEIDECFRNDFNSDIACGSSKTNGEM